MFKIKDLTSVFRRSQEAEKTAASLPELQLEASKLATKLRGEKKSGRPGDSDRFRQFRPFENGDPMSRVDARRSASYFDHNGEAELQVRQREQDITNILYLWRKKGPSMDFKSDKAHYSKQEAADILTMAMGYIALNSKEHFTMLGTDMRLRSDKGAATELATHMFNMADGQNETLPDHPLHRGQLLKKDGYVVMFSDFFPTRALFEEEELYDKSPEEIRDAMMKRIADKLQRFHTTGVKGYLIQILDPQEIEFDYKGTIRFEEEEGSAVSHEVDKAEALRDKYLEARRMYQEALETTIKSLPGWKLSTYVTDRPLIEALMPLYPHLRQPERPVTLAPGGNK